MRFKNFPLVICVALLPLFALAQNEHEDQHQHETEPLQSDWLELVKGYRGEAVGAEMREINGDDSDGSREITLAIPKSAIRHPDEIEEVVVYGRKPEEPEPLDIEYEWVDDYDNDNYGLIIRLGEDSQWPIRLFMYSDPGFIR